MWPRRPPNTWSIKAQGGRSSFFAKDATSFHNPFAGVVTTITAALLPRPICSRDEPYLSRRVFLHTSVMAGAGLAIERHLLTATPAARPSFPLADCHVHLSPTLSIEPAVNLGKERQVPIGIVEHPGRATQF